MTAYKNFNTVQNTPSILICPLDWGLGHATRCIPIIEYLLSIGTNVTIGADGNSGKLLKKQFPRLNFLDLPGYNIKYSKHKRSLKWKLLIQIPKILNTIRKEHQWLKNQVKIHHFDLVISDNRFGLYHKQITSVYITHQLLIKTGNSLLDKLAQKIHYFFINKFHHCWVPDAKENGLAGELSHPDTLPRNISYIGPVSRFEKNIEPEKYPLTIILSGPEPQRSILESKLIDNLSGLNIRVLLIRGTKENNKLRAPINWQVQDLVPAAQLNDIVNQSSFIVGRAGYSSIMDFAKLQKPAILIPTPGQTEQEYLGKYLMDKNMFYVFEQNDFPIKSIMNIINEFPFTTVEYDWNNYKFAIQNLIKTLKPSE